MTELKSIWHTADEKPNDGFGMVVYYSKEYDGELLVGYYNTEYEDFRPLDEYYCEEKTVKKWCYLDDLLALETKLDRTRKALDVAINAMKSAGTHNSINCIARGEDPSKDDVGITINHALEQITALEQKEQ